MGEDLNRIFKSSGGYRRTHYFGLVCLVYHATTKFCERNFDYRSDKLGKTVGQMVGAARSARQNIVEGSSRARTAREQEVRQYDVARGSLDELAGDYEAFLTDRYEAPWSEDDERAKMVSQLMLDEFMANDDIAHNYGVFVIRMRKRFENWLESKDPIIAANSILITIRRANSMLRKHMETIVREIIDSGGFSEALARARNEARDAEAIAAGAPRCPLCNSVMRRCLAKRGPSAGSYFWSCSRYPVCTATLPDNHA